jgi:hypothetical protein
VSERAWIGQSLRVTRRALLAAACVLIAACSGSHPGANSATTTTKPSGTTAASLGAALPRFTRRTAQGVAIAFAIDDDDPIIARVRERLIGESKFEVANGRRPVDSRCLPTLAYRVSANYGTATFKDDFPTSPLSAEPPRGGVHVTYTSDQKHELAILWMSTSDPRVDSIQFASAGLVDRQHVVGGWVALALVLSPVGTTGDETVVTGQVSTRAKSGSVLSRLSIPSPPTSNPCTAPFGALS